MNQAASAGTLLALSLIPYAAVAQAAPRRAASRATRSLASGPRSFTGHKGPYCLELKVHVFVDNAK
jgi:hypothetical protein